MRIGWAEEYTEPDTRSPNCNQKPLFKILALVFFAFTGRRTTHASACLASIFTFSSSVNSLLGGSGRAYHEITNRPQTPAANNNKGGLKSEGRAKTVRSRIVISGEEDGI